MKTTCPSCGIKLKVIVRQKSITCPKCAKPFAPVIDNDSAGTVSSASRVTSSASKAQKKPELYCCDNCKRFFGREQISFNTDQINVAVCPTCKAPTTELETKTVTHTARVTYISACVVLLVTFIAMCQLPEHYLDQTGLLGAIIGIPGIFSIVVLVVYFYWAVGFPFGGGEGWRIFTKLDIVSPPAWYRKPTIGHELFREFLISIIAGVACLVFGFVVYFTRGGK